MELATSTRAPENGATPFRSSNGSGHSANKAEVLFKVLVIGELGCGKTSFIKRYVHQFFSEHYRATIGVDFALKVINWDDQTVVRLQLWDIAGQERFGNMTRVYYKDAVGAFLLFDLTRADTFHAVEKWKEDLDSKVLMADGRPIPCVLVGNKCDQPASGPAANHDRLDAFARDKGFSGWFAASARDNINVEQAAEHLIKAIFESRAKLEAAGVIDGKNNSTSLLSAANRNRDTVDGGNGPRILLLEEDGGGGTGGGRNRGGRDCKC